MVAVAILAGFISGGCNAALIAFISRSIRAATTYEMGAMLGAFPALVLVALVASVLSQMMLIRLSHQAVFQLQLRLSRQILGSELANLERLGSPRLLATLVDDVQTVAEAVRLVPFLCIDLAMVLGGFGYIFWLDWSVFLMVCGLTVVAVGSCQFLLNQGRKQLALAREEQDSLFKHFRTITDGTKELKLHYRRRQAFLREDLQTTAGTFRRHSIWGLTLFSMTSTWGKLIFFFALGFVVFALPHFMTLNLMTLSGLYFDVYLPNSAHGAPVKQFTHYESGWGCSE